MENQLSDNTVPTTPADINNTLPTNISSTDNTRPINTDKRQKQKSPEDKLKGFGRWVWILAGIGFIILATLLGAFAGYRTAIRYRLQQQNDQIALEATTQYQLGIQDLQDGHLEAARKRFEYIVQIDPKFPGAAEKLTEVMVAMAQQSTPTAVKTPTVVATPTKDMRPSDEIFQHAYQLLRNQDWQGAIDVLDSLRTIDINYRALEVDGLYYIALRYRGVQKIINGSNLEGGIYDLALAERFGPLDREADSFRNSARAYMAGTSFWGIDWFKVVEYLGQIYSSLPNLMDGSGLTVAERYRTALIHLGDQYAVGGDYCGARDYYQQALAISQDMGLAPTATAAQYICSPPTSTPMPTVAITPSPTMEIGSETPTVEETTPSP